MLQGYLLVAAVCLAGTQPVVSHDEVKAKPPRRVGEIMVVGNKVVNLSAFLDRLGLYPGMLYTPADLKEAERRLASLRWQAGVRSRITVKEREDTEFQVIVVQVQESRFTRLAGPIHNTVSDHVGLLHDLAHIDWRHLGRLLSVSLREGLE
jgi:hypothetical protein